MTGVYSIYQAKAHLSEIIRAVKLRRRVTITERGRPVAEVIPYGASGRPSLETRVAELEARGLVLPAGGGVDAIRPIATRQGALARFLDERE